MAPRSRAARHRTSTLEERRRKARVRERDQICRWPDCDVFGTGFWGQPEVAHTLHHKGMGGDPLLLRSQVDSMALLCRWHHQGPFGLHSGKARLESLTDLGTNGPVRASQLKGNDWVEVGVTTPRVRQVA